MTDRHILYRIGEDETKIALVVSGLASLPGIAVLRTGTDSLLVTGGREAVRSYASGLTGWAHEPDHVVWGGL